MATNFDYEIFEMFKDQCYAQLPSMESKILSLENPKVFKENINDLFRMFHNYKSTANYLGLESISQLVTKTEDVLGGLRSLDQLNDEGLIEWLLKIKDQFEVWMDEMDLGLNSFTPCDQSLLTSIKTTRDRPKPSEVIKILNILYIDPDATRAKIIVNALNKILKSVVYAKDMHILDVYTGKEAPHIVLLNTNEENIENYDCIHKAFCEASVIVVYDKVGRTLLLELGRKGIHNILKNPIKGQELKRMLLQIAHVFHSQRRVLINNKKIYEFIEQLEPLPSTIMQIQQVCDDDELSINDLVEVIKTDPIIVGIILNAAMSPIYGLKSQVNSIENVVAIFGKKTIKAISLGMISSYLGEMRLDAYKINEELFMKTGSLRLALMNAWYTKVDKEQLSILGTTAILGNLGQLLIAKEIEKLDLIEAFREISASQGFTEAEERLLHTNTPYVSSDILSFWQLKPEIVDSIRYSGDVNNAPLEVHALAVANYIVYTLVDLNAEVLESIPDDIYFLLAQEDLDPKLLENALADIQNL